MERVIFLALDGLSWNMIDEFLTNWPSGCDISVECSRTVIKPKDSCPKPLYYGE